MGETVSNQKIHFASIEAEQFVTKHSDPRYRSRKKKSFQKLVLAHSDIHSAYKTCELFREKVALPAGVPSKKTTGMDNPLYSPLLEAIIVSYARPFTDNNRLGVLPKKWTLFDDSELRHAHDMILRVRNELVAHSDQCVRKIQIVPPNDNSFPIKEGMKAVGPGFAIRGYGISLHQVSVFYRLTAFQGNRLWGEVEKLLDGLYLGMELPAKAFDLRIDEGL